MPQLNIYRGNALLNEYSFTGQDIVTIGRANTNDIVLGDTGRKVSRYHAALVRERGSQDRYFVRDLGSRYSLRVSGDTTDRRILSDNEFVEIAGYRILFSTQHNGRVAPLLRIVNKRIAPGGFDESTIDFTYLSSLDISERNEPQREFLEHLRKANASRIDVQDYAATMMAGLCSATRSDRGFLRLLTHRCSLAPVDLGMFGMRSNQPIEISDPNFMDTLREGCVVHEGSVVLVPIVRDDTTIGFVTLDRTATSTAFAPEELKFLSDVGMMLGRFLKDAGPNAQSVRLPDACRWPLGLIGNSKHIADIRRQIRAAASNSMNVLILGATGTGKDLVARGIHTASARTGPFVAQNVGQTTESLAEAMIFGYAPRSGIAGADPKGAPGWFEIADGGTLFLDEIHRLTGTMQDKFLRVLQDKEVQRIGSRNTRKVDVKVLAATDYEIEKALADEVIRQAFYYRFGQTIHVAPLRARPEDIPLLAYCFLDSSTDKTAAPPKSISHRAMECMLHYDWPGNVRELQHCIANAVGEQRDVIFSWDLPQRIRQTSNKSQAVYAGPETGVMSRVQHESLNELERDKIMEVLESTRGNKTKSAEVLGISRMSILNKMDKYQIPRSYGDPRYDA